MVYQVCCSFQGSLSPKPLHPKPKTYESETLNLLSSTCIVLVSNPTELCSYLNFYISLRVHVFTWYITLTPKYLFRDCFNLRAKYLLLGVHGPLKTKPCRTLEDPFREPYKGPLRGCSLGTWTRWGFFLTPKMPMPIPHFSLDHGFL